MSRRYAAQICPCCGQPDGTYWVFPNTWNHGEPLEPRPETVDQTIEWLKDRRQADGQADRA